MAKFVPFNGKGLCHFTHIDKMHVCTFCGKKFKTFEQYETHWPKCTGVCKERPLRPFNIPQFPRFPNSFKQR
ncbi:hypothetical protein IWW46_004392 [Coemansia sp. RSA 2440]|nr:hypothetical protein J3F81_006248 [Coemansia sp. RSA 371]KAJ2439562.1 hypothetical protein IWW46_004392 [Coemansia sp. RSA 2440]